MLPITNILKAIKQNSFSIEVENKEADRIRFSKSLKPVVVWNVNEYCNMTCPHCYASAKRMKKGMNELSTEDAKYIIKQLYNYGIRILIFSGGEPLLRKDIFELIQFSSDLGFQCHLSTNGVLIQKKTAEILKRIQVQYVGISVDGLAEFNDSYRGMIGGFRRAFRAFQFLKEEGIMRGLRVTLSKANQNQLFPLIDYAIENSIDRFYISHLLYSGRGEELSNDDLSWNSIRTIMWKLFRLADRHIDNGYPMQFVSGGNDIDGAFLYLYVKQYYGDSKARQVKHILEKRRGNSSGEKIINIDHLGNVHPSQFWRGYTAGNLLTDPLESIMQDDLLIKLKEREKYLYECKDCVFLMMCRGSHRERALAFRGDLWAKDPACYLTDEERRQGILQEEPIYHYIHI